MDIPGFSRSSCFSYCALKAYTVVRGLTRGLATLPLPYPMRILHMRMAFMRMASIWHLDC